MSEKNINEDLREACAIGDEDLIRNLINMGAQINNKNTINGMTCLHWAALRNNRAAVKLCLEYGADTTLSRHDGKIPGQLTTDLSIANLLGVFNSAELKIINDSSKFVPNYLKNPVFPFAKRSESEILSQTEREKVTALIKIKLCGDDDFIELELEKFASFDNFKQEIKSELKLNGDIKLIRKLPNVLIRDERDLQRLKEGNELEIELIDISSSCALK